jgi:hypothetical protein
MTFDEILTQVLELLQREKRVSYRALKRRFDLDDNDLEDVKDELIYAKKLALDEDNRVLVERFVNPLQAVDAYELVDSMI